MSKPTDATPRRYADVLLRKDVLAGLMFIAVAALGLWLSRNYPVGTTLRMGTGYVPRLLCWVLLGLGAFDCCAGCRSNPTANAAGGGRIAARRRGVPSSSSLQACRYSASRSNGSAWSSPSRC